MIPDGARVYVVDDDASFVRSLLRLLAACGIRAEGFTSAISLLAREPSEGPVCALVDLRMPGVSGLELQEALVREGRELPVVFISGTTDAEDREDALRSGAVDFLTKPVDEGHLLAALALAFGLDDGVIGGERAGRAGPLRIAGARDDRSAAVESGLLG